MPEHRHPDLEYNIEELAGALLGPPRSALAGGGREESEGLAYQVKDINRKLSNGGIRIKLPWGVWAAVIAAVSGIVIQLIATLGGAG